jgi:hypothetical protein
MTYCSETTCKREVPGTQRETGKEPNATVDQKGSFIDDTKLCLDFSWNAEPDYRSIEVEKFCRA